MKNNPYIGTPPQNTISFGSSRAGKTTSTLRALSRVWLDPPQTRSRWSFRKRPPAEKPGMVCLTVKAGEGDNLAQMAAICGRELDLVRVTPGGEWKGDPLRAYFRTKGASAITASKQLGEMARLAGGHGGKESEPFWALSRERNLYFALVLLKAAYKAPAFKQLYALLVNLPYGAVDDKFFESAAGEVAKLAARNATAGEEADVKRALEWVLKEWPATADKLRESYRQDALSVVFPMTAEPIASLLDGDSIGPDLLNNGGIVVLDAPLLRYQAAGAIWQKTWAMTFDAAMVDRPKGARTVFKYIDEYQYFATPDHDVKVATVCSESNYFHILATQTLPTWYAALGGSAQNDVASMLANSPLKVWHYTDCHTTAKFVSDMLGQSKQMMFSGGGGGDYDLFDDLTGQHQSKSTVGFSEQWQPVFRPETLTTFRRGGKVNGFVCDALITESGKPPRVAAIPQTLL